MIQRRYKTRKQKAGSERELRGEKELIENKEDGSGGILEKD